MTITPYPAYKHSGTEWLGYVPEHWGIKRLRSGFDLMKRPIRPSDGNVTAFRDGQVTLRSNRRIDGFTEADKEIGYQGIEPGDLVIHAMDAFAGAIGVSDSRGKSTPVYSVCRARPGHNPRFFALTMRHIALSGYITSLGKGVRERSTDFRWADARDVVVPVPSVLEQDAIIRFLDGQTARIDALIGKQERLIEILAERRQAVISHAVTKGLDPTAPMKESGIYWLREVPASWSVRKFSHATRINGGQVDPKVEPFRSMTLVAPNHIEQGTGRLLAEETAEEQGADSGKYQIRKGQVIYSKIRPALRKAVIAPVDCLSSADMYGIDADAMLLSNDYLLVLMLSRPFTQFVVDVSMRVAMPKVNRETLAAGYLWFPSLDMQAQILEHIGRETSRIDTLAAKAREMINVLKERRRALISAAVTGKIDVRGLA